MIPVPQGYRFAVAAAGFKRKDRYDVALVVSDAPAVAAGAFTRSLFRAAPVRVAEEMLAAGNAMRAVLINSGNANACTGERGLTDCRRTVDLVAQAVGVAADGILPASTGVIGQPMDMGKWEQAVPTLGKNLGSFGPEDFARAIMTTDNGPKMSGRTVMLDGKEVSVLGMAKGAGMIAPNMATMLGVVLCDAAVDPKVWQEMVSQAVETSFNRITVDGDTSTNDCVFALANGASGASAASDKDLDILAQAVAQVCKDLAILIVADAEGGTKVLHIKVRGAVDRTDAELAARAVGNSPLVKTAMYGRDANWGRIVAALGRSGARFDPEAVCVDLAGVTLFRHGLPVPVDEELVLAPKLLLRDIPMDIRLGDGPGEYELYASDLTHDYIDCNASYRT